MHTLSRGPMQGAWPSGSAPTERIRGWRREGLVCTRRGPCGQLDRVWIPRVLCPVRGAASSKSLNTSEQKFSLIKQKIYQDELFLGLSSVCTCMHTCTHCIFMHMHSIYIYTGPAAAYCMQCMCMNSPHTHAHTHPREMVQFSLTQWLLQWLSRT